MEEKVNVTMTALDTLVSGSDLQMIKAIIPYMKASEQKFISIYVKFVEFTNTIKYFQNADEDVGICSEHSESGAGSMDMLKDIRMHCSDAQRETLDMLINFMDAFQIYNTYKETMEKEGKEDSNPLGMLSAFLTPEQQSMFEMYQSMMDM